MPFVGEQPKQAGTLKVFGRAATIEIDIAVGTFTVTKRSGSVFIGVS